MLTDWSECVCNILELLKNYKEEGILYIFGLFNTTQKGISVFCLRKDTVFELEDTLSHSDCSFDGLNNT